MVGNKFQDIILKYSRDNAREVVPTRYDFSAEEVNALCGDEVEVFVTINAETLDISYHRKGCALCAASAAIMGECVSGRDRPFGIAIVQRFLKDFPQGKVISDQGIGIEALFDMRRFPARERCVLLPWQALIRCLS